jgi:hypothetical protein
MTTAYEIRVDGELARPTLHSLGCAHCLAGSQTMVRVEATPSGLEELVRACAGRGLTIESIVRVDPATSHDAP